MDDDKRKGIPPESDAPTSAEDNRSADLANTAELLAEIDKEVNEYSFSIDDILAEFGVEREVEPEAEPVPEEPQKPLPELTADELTERLGEVAQQMHAEQEEQKLREIEQQVMKAAEQVTEAQDEYPAEPDQIGEDGKVHIFEEEEEPEQKKRGIFRRKKNDEPSEKRRVMRETGDMKKVFGRDLDQVFGADADVRESRDGGISAEDFERDHADEPRRRGRKHRFTVEETPEESNEPDVEPEEEAKRIVEALGRSRLRLIIAAVVTVLLAIVSFAPNIGLSMPEFATYIERPFMYIFICVLLQLGVMALCFETTAIGIRDLVTLKPNMESVVVFANITSILHLFFVAIKPEWGGYYGYSMLGALSMLISSYYLRRLELAKLKSCRAAAGMSRPYIVAAEPELYDDEIALIKYRAQKPLHFVSRLNAPDLNRRVWRIAAPIMMLGSVALAAVASFGSGAGERFVWCIAAISAASAPLSLLMPYCLAFAKAARSLYSLGEAITGWSAAEALSSADSIVVSDSDVFPPGHIALNGLKVYRGYPKDKVIAYAASLIGASGAAIARPFAEQHSNQTSEPLPKVNLFKFYENGGIGGEIEGQTVLAGTATFMMRNGISIPKDVGGKTTVFIAVNLEIVGVFAVSYNASPAVRRGLSMLMRQNVTPVFATRDFNISPAMIETRFGLSTDTIDFPKEAERLALSDPDRLFVGRTSAVISREGLKHYAECVVCARNLRRAVRLSTALTLASAIIGVLVMFYLCFTGSMSTASPLNLLLYTALWLIPNFITARWVNA